MPPQKGIINRVSPQIAAAVDVLRAGGLVAFPTETVYGLGADATRPDAIARIFQAKGRPSTNPLIVHVADMEMARHFAARWPGEAQQLAEVFWPGPLTLVLPRTARIPPIVTAGRDSVGLRVPDHPLALQLLQAFGGPIAAPSANRSNRVSPTTAQHVRGELGTAVDLILDGGPCRVGIESTVLALPLTGAADASDICGSRPVILRAGAITRAQIEAVIGPVSDLKESSGASLPRTPPGQGALSPGLEPVHYAPSAKAYRFESSQIDLATSWQKQHASQNVIWLVRKNSPAIGAIAQSFPIAHELLAMPTEASEYARELYANLHAADLRGFSHICVEMPPDTPEWTAVRDRLTLATRVF